MRRITIITLLLFIGSIAADAQAPKGERIKEIRAVYAQAKKKIDQNGKNGQSPKDMSIVLNRLEDEEIPLYDTETLKYYFDEAISAAGVITKQPYFIVEDWGNHGHIRYREVLLDPKNRQVMFCYMRGETDAGFVVESRYYYDEKGRCIEEKHNTSNSWTGADSEKENAETYLKFFDKVINNNSTSASPSAAKRPTAAKAKRLSHIRTVYAQAKEKIAANDKRDMSDDLHITIHDLGDDQPPRTIDIKFYFDKDGCYFINRHTKSMMLDEYDEYLFESQGSDLIFSYCRSLEEGETWEWRYYYDENGQCIETKSNHEDTDGGHTDKEAVRHYLDLFNTLINAEM
jgi:YD repeat-containing protein